jgi:hypothetical protein
MNNTLLKKAHYGNQDFFPIGQWSSPYSDHYEKTLFRNVNMGLGEASGCLELGG